MKLSWEPPEGSTKAKYRCSGSGGFSPTPSSTQPSIRGACQRFALSTGIRIEIMTASSASVRGWTLVGAVLDEIAYWPSEDAADPDHEIVASLRPGLSTVPGAMLVAVSSPYARRGELWRQYEQNHGRDGDVLVWQAASRDMNPSIPERVVERALAEDEAAARAEWLGMFRADVETFIALESIRGVHRRPRARHPRTRHSVEQ